MESENVASDASSDGETDLPEDIYRNIKKAWINEALCPELLPYAFDGIYKILFLVSNMQRNIDRANPNDLRTEVHRIELQRIKYIVSSYLRCRLQKIEKYGPRLVKDIQEATVDEQILSPEELTFAQKLTAITEVHLQTEVLQHLMGEYNTIDLPALVEKPDTENTFVFFRANKDINNVLITEETDSSREREIVHIRANSQHITPYSAISQYVLDGSVDLK